MSQAFQQAIEKLVTDGSYRTAVESDPNRLLGEYPLSRGEVGLLMQVWDRCQHGDVVGHIDVIVIICCCCCI